MRAAINHRGAESTDGAQSLSLCYLRVLCVSVVNLNFHNLYLKLNHYSLVA